MILKLLFCMFTITLATPSYAAQPRLHLGLDVFTVADGDDAWNDEAKDAINLLVDDYGYDSASYKMETSAGIGARLGLRYPISASNDSYIGGSLGYVKGPEADTTVLGYDTGNGNGTHKQNAQTSFIRLLLEIGKTMPLSGNTKFSIGAGVGLAQGTIKSEVTNTGSFVSFLGLDSSSSDDKNWSGLTWEVSPSISFPSGTTEIELGARIAGFPKLKESEDWTEFKWNPFGIFAALHF